MGTGKLLGKPNKLGGNDLRWTSIQSRRSRNTPSRFMLQKPGISSGSYDPVGSRLPFSFSFSHKKKGDARIKKAFILKYDGIVLVIVLIIYLKFIF